MQAYGADKVRRQLYREDIGVARCTVQRADASARAAGRASRQDAAHDHARSQTLCSLDRVNRQFHCAAAQSALRLGQPLRDLQSVLQFTSIADLVLRVADHSARLGAKLLDLALHAPPLLRMGRLPALPARVARAPG